MERYKPDGRPNMKSFYGKTQAAAKKKKLEYLLAKEAGLLVEKSICPQSWQICGMKATKIIFPLPHGNTTNTHSAF